MKRIFLFILLATSFFASAQVPTGAPVLQANRYYRFTQYVRADSGLMIPYRDTAYRPLTPSVLVRPADNLLYYWNGSRWISTSLTYSFLTTQNNGSPTITSAGSVVTMNIPNAGPSSSAGTITNGAQTVAGAKTFTSSVSILGGPPLYFSIETPSELSASTIGGGVRFLSGTSDSAFIRIKREPSGTYSLLLGAYNELLSPKISLINGGYSLGYSTSKSEYAFDVSWPQSDSATISGFQNFSWNSIKVFGVDKRGAIYSTGIDSTPAGANMLWWDPLTKTIKRTAIPSSGGGSTETISNVGTGTGIYKDKVGVDFRLKSLLSDGTIQRISNTNDISIGVIPNTTIQKGQYFIAGVPIGTRKGINITAGGGIGLTGSDDAVNDRVNIQISGAVGEITEVVNVAGTGSGVVRSKSSDSFYLKRIVAGTNVVVTDMADSIRISATASGTPGYTSTATIENGAPWVYDSVLYKINDSAFRVKSFAIGYGLKKYAVTDSSFGVMGDTLEFPTRTSMYRVRDSLTALILAGGGGGGGASTYVENGAPFTADSLLRPSGSDTIVFKSFSRGFGLIAHNITDSTFGAKIDSSSSGVPTWARLYKVRDSLAGTFVSTNVYNSSGTLTGAGDRVITMGTKNFTIDASGTGDFSFTLGSDATGDIYYRNSSGRLARLPIGTAGYSLHVDAGLPSWQPDATGGGSGVTSVGLSAFSGITVTNSPITSVGTIALSTTLSGILYGNGSGFAAASITSPLQYSAGILSVRKAATADSGYLSATDWNTFNGKQDNIATGTASQFYAWDKTMKAITTAMVSESGNLYYTDARARSSISASSPLVYNSSTGALTINLASGSQDGYLSSANWTTFNNKQPAIQFKDEGSNIGTSGIVTEVDFTGSGLIASVTGGVLTVSGTGAAGGEENTASNIGTGSSLYKEKIGVDMRFRKINAGSNISVTENANDVTIGFTGITSIGMVVPSGLSVNTPITSNGTFTISTALSGIIYGTGTGFTTATIGSPLTFSAGVLDIQTATGSQEGSLSAADWITFNNKQANIATGTTNQFYAWDKTMKTVTTAMITESGNLFYTDARSRAALNGVAPIAVNTSTGDVSIQQASSTLPGYLSSADWTTFNSKVGSVSNVGGGMVLSAGVAGGVFSLKTLYSNGSLNITAAPTNGVTLAVVDNTSTQKIQTYGNGVLAGTRKALNIIPSTGVSVSAVDNAGADRVDVTLTNTAPDQVITLAGTSGITVTGTYPSFSISGAGVGGGEANTASNLGASGSSLYKQKVGVDLQFRKIIGTSGITVTENANDITLVATGVSSVGVSVPSGLSASGPVTTSGTIAITTALSGMLYGTGTGFAAATVSSPLTYSAGTLGIQTASSVLTGALSSANWTTFNNKQDNITAGTTNQFYAWDKTMKTVTTDMITEGANMFYTDARARNAITASAPLIYLGAGVFSVQAGGAGQNGYISSANWTTFNNKQAAVRHQDEGVNLGAAGSSEFINFVGAGVTASQASNVTTVTIPGGTAVQYQDEGTNTGSAGAVSAINFTGSNITSTFSAGTLTVALTGGATTDGNNFTSGFSFFDGGSTMTRTGLSDIVTTGLSTSVVPEGTRLYYSDARARNSISLTSAGSSGAAAYNATTGVLNVPNYTLAGLGGVATSRLVTINGVAQNLSADRIWNVGTVTSIALATGTTGTDISVSGSPITTAGTITLNIPTASASTRGALSSTDWTTFNSKQGAISLTTTGTSGVSTFSAGVLNIPNYTLAGLGGAASATTLTINGSTQSLAANRTWNVGTVTSVSATGGTGISITGSPVTGAGGFTITNTAPDQVVSITAGSGVSVTGTYPAFTVSSTATGTVTSVGLTAGTAGTDVAVTGSPITGAGSFTLNIPTASASARGALSSANWTTFNNKQNALSLTTTGSSGAATLISDVLNIPTYTLAGLGGVAASRTLTINGVVQDLSANRSWSVGTLTSYGVVAGTGMSVSGAAVTGAGTQTITNTAPDQVVSIAGTGGVAVTGTYPSFTVSGSSITSVYASRSTMTAATNYDFALVKHTVDGGAYEISNNVLKVGHGADDYLRTITLNATLYVSEANFFTNSYVQVGTLPAGYRPTAMITFPIAESVPGTPNPATTHFRTSGGTGILNGTNYSNASGYINPATGAVYVMIRSISQFATVSGVNTVIIPIVVTYFTSGNNN